MRLQHLFMPFFVFCFFGVSAQKVHLVPYPQQLLFTKGTFTLSPSTVIVADEKNQYRAGDLFNQYLKQFYGYSLKFAEKSTGKNEIVIARFPEIDKGNSYKLSISPQTVRITGLGPGTTFQAFMTLLQLLSPGAAAMSSFTIPCMEVSDQPSYAYRGMHLDVARHFFPTSFVKKYIDYLSFYKFNQFHWHLTDDQGWRIDIPEYPRLTEVGAWRNGTIIGRYPGTGNDNQRYGGFYTNSEIEEVIAYARDRGINVIPEIEMPGHSSAAIAAYPWLSCFPEKNTVIPSWPSDVSMKYGGKQVQETWGVFEDIFCAGNDSTFTFLHTVLDNVIKLFPSEYIHVGGDESPKSHWNKCPKCQARIKEKGLKDGEELQSWFMTEIDHYLTSKGRKMFGWDEIIEGGISPNALIMSWRGEKGGIAAARAKHQVVMTPQKPLYFDHTQSRNEDSLVIGGYNPIEAVYAYNPIGSIDDKVAIPYILGAQANLWAEYIEGPTKVEYMIFPRMAALAEVLWRSGEKRTWSDFESELPYEFQRYAMWGAHYSRAVNDARSLVYSDAGKAVWQVMPKRKNGVIKFVNTQNEVSYITTDSTAFPLKGKGYYTIQQVEAIPARDAEPVAVSNPMSIYFVPHLATGKKITLAKTPNERYAGQGGAYGMINGISSLKGLSYPDWQGWVGDDMDAVIDLEQSQPISVIRLHTLDQNGSWVYLPKNVLVYGSNDGKNFKALGSSSEFQVERGTMGWITVQFPATSYRYIRVLAENFGKIPEGKPGAGSKAWLITDEIQVY